ncbi:HlyD family efflux transporter periplasmic adaptor subunit [Treponema sp. HNW]|uniref:HlyD family secretion protein n=1 Tax=Treponema sp. HNW TaxID=3116654 RepID=UPI003D0CB692
MKERVMLIPLEDLEYGQEIVLHREPKILSVTVWLIVALISSALLWIVFGKTEETVRARGTVRPVSNVSSVKNAVAGEITALYYRNGKAVEKGELLLHIDSKALEAKAEALQTAARKFLLTAEGLKETEKSFYKKKNLINKNNSAAYTRFQSYMYRQRLFEERFSLAEKTWKEAKALPKEAMTAVRLRELEYEKNIAFLNAETHKTDFITTINTEYIQTSVEIENIKSQMEQIRQSLRNCCVYAPISGNIQEISSLNTGDYLFADQRILNIIPFENGAYKAELKIPAKMRGRLEPGMKIKMRFPAFPFYEFGGAESIINTIDPDASTEPNGALYFTVSSDIGKAFLQDKKRNIYPLKSGLEIEGRIILKEQTILRYILRKLDMVW